MAAPSVAAIVEGGLAGVAAARTMASNNRLYRCFVFAGATAALAAFANLKRDHPSLDQNLVGG